MLTLTEEARKQILLAMADQPEESLALRVAIAGRGPAGFRYDLDLVPAASRAESDVVLELDDFEVFIPQESVAKLEGATIDFVHRLGESGFKFDNPNALWDDPAAQAVQRVIDEQINPAIAGHGGFVSLLDFKDGRAYIALGGGCQGCGMADVTLRQGIEVMIREAVPEVVEILDTTDHAAGTNPYYQPAKGGESPLA